METREKRIERAVADIAEFAPPEPQPARKKRQKKAEKLKLELFDLEGKTQEEVMRLITQEPPLLKPLNDRKMIVSLQRKWRLTYPDRAIPDDLETLKALIPIAITRKERLQFLHGSLEEAKKTFLKVVNTSWTQEDLKRSLLEAGVHNALDGFDAETRKSLVKGVIRFLPEGDGNGHRPHS